MILLDWINGLPEDTKSAFWTIVAASLCSVMCAIIGVWLVLQRVSMLGDAISHSVLPGIVVTFLLFGTRASFPMLVGAAVAGLLTVVLTRQITRISGVRDDASMGVVFTVLFALGVVLIRRYADKIDLDPGCVLYGLLEFVPLNLNEYGMPIALNTLGPAFLIILAFLLLLRKELLLLAFDPPLARALGKKPNLVYYLLMAFVAIATVASFEAVGSILVIAMLIGPASAAQLLTHKLKAMFWIAAGLAVMSSVAGYWTAVLWNTSVAGMMAVCIGAFYGLAVVFSPVGGLLHNRLEHAKRARNIQNEDGLAAIFRLRETGQPATAAAIQSTVGAQWFRPEALERLEKGRLVTRAGDAFSLTEAGRSVATSLVRRHRLLETYFVQELEKDAATVASPPTSRSTT